MRDGWTIKPLGKVGSFQRGGGFLKNDFVEDGFPCIHYGQIHTVFGVSTDKHLKCIPESIALKKSKLATTGDVILAITSEDVECSCKCTAWLGNYDVAVGSHAAIYHHILNPKFVSYYFRGAYFNRAKQKFTHGIKVIEIKPADIATIEIAYPSPEKQELIVEELDLLNKVIEEKESQLRDLETLAQSIFFEMFGDPVSNEKGWSKQAIGKLGRVITGSTPSTKDTRNYSSADYSFFKPGDIDKQSVSFLASADSYISSSAFANSRKLPAGSVLTTCIGIIGKVGILKKEATCNQQINAIIPEKVNSTYLAYVISFSKSIFESMANGPIVKIINKGDFSKVELPIPPMKLQKSFAEKIQEIQLQKERIEASKRDVEDLLSNRMTYYFD